MWTGGHFFWFLVSAPAVIIAGVVWLEVIGLPHLAWEYRYERRARGAMSDRYYLSCTYVGPFGGWRQSAVDGWCPWFAWRTRHQVK